MVLKFRKFARQFVFVFSQKFSPLLLYTCILDSQFQIMYTTLLWLLGYLCLFPPIPTCYCLSPLMVFKVLSFLTCAACTLSCCLSVHPSVWQKQFSTLFQQGCHMLEFHFNLEFHQISCFDHMNFRQRSRVYP